MGNLCTKQTYHICSLLVLTIVSFTVIITLCYLVIKGTLAMNSTHFLQMQAKMLQKQLGTLKFNLKAF